MIEERGSDVSRRTRCGGDADFAGTEDYRITVQGRIGEEWRDRLSGMKLRVVNRGDSAPHTVLRGAIHDQAALQGVLDTLYNLHLPILEVKRVSPPAHE